MHHAVASKQAGGFGRGLAIAGFAAYALVSESSAVGSEAAVAFHMQTLLCLAVVVALAQRRAWAPWFAIGIGLSGLVIDLALLRTFAFAPAFVLDTAMQGGLLWLALRTRDPQAPVAANVLTAGSPARQGWTFAFAAGMLPPLAMAPFFPWGSGACYEAAHVGSGPLLLLPLGALASVWLLARLRTVGLLLLVPLGFALGGLVAQDLLGLPPHQFGYFAVSDTFVLVGLVMLVAALVPLGPAAARILFGRRAR